MPIAPSNLVKVVCPSCHGGLEEAAGEWRCQSCGQRYPINRGVISFLGERDVYNVGESQDHQLEHWSGTAALRAKIRQSALLSAVNELRVRLSLSGRRDRVFLKEMKPNAHKRPIILDVGCGAGRHYFAEYGRVVGLEPVLPLLLEARKIYDEAFQGSALKMPFADDSFDYVVSTDVLGHILPPDKDSLFAEMFRVLKPGGRTVHCAEVDSDSLWFRIAKRNPDLFHKYFIDRPGHFGLEKTTELHARFQKHGFKLVKSQPISGLVSEIGTSAVYYDNDYLLAQRWLRPLVAVSRVLKSSLVIREALGLFLELLMKIEERIAPLNNAQPCVLIVFEKPLR